jgi:hypothetical protein
MKYPRFLENNYYLIKSGLSVLSMLFKSKQESWLVSMISSYALLSDKDKLSPNFLGL